MINNKIFLNISKKIIHFSKKVPSLRNSNANYIIFSFLFIIITSLVFSFNSAIKKKRLEAIDDFVSNNQTVLLKNYILNQLKSPYLEYDYIVQNNDTIESILKKFSVKQSEINFIVDKIKKEKLSAISPKQKMKFVLKRTKDKKDKEILKIDYNRKSSEKTNLKFRRSLYFVENIYKGEKITEKNVRSIRPGYGLSPKFYESIIGKTVNRDIEAGTPVKEKYIN